jgi:hypothetical protein
MEPETAAMAVAVNICFSIEQSPVSLELEMSPERTRFNTAAK